MATIFEIAGNVLLFCLVFGMSATVDVKRMRKQMKNRRAILTGIMLQFFFLPFLGFAVVKALDLNHAMGISLLVVTSSPGGSYSNWWCSLFNADLALSVTMTAVSTMLSVLMLPLNLLLYARFTYDNDVISILDWTSLFVALVIVISAIFIGLVVSAKVHSHKFNKMANQVGNIAGISLVVFSALVSNSGGGEAQLWERPWKFYVGVAAPCVLGLAFSNGVTSLFKLKKPERITVSIECCYQNVGIATSVALTMFEGQDLAEAMGVPLFYGLVEAIAIGIYCVVAWKLGWTKAPADTKFWTMISTSFEVIMAEARELQAIEVCLTEEDELETTSSCESTIFAYFKFDKIFVSAGNSKEGKHVKEPSGYDISQYNIEEDVEDEESWAGLVCGSQMPPNLKQRILGGKWESS
uniref:Uncharacterized protein n=1 Tax=Trieres chinensis TaxID=1514140 RepID=A0A7S1ZP77_TRICV|mmetsp:Transcript_30334/g.61857  ORF Transcript_30334/g.61857 Transcript_30334/m.61857 type:complete len:410 (+) Transcript_30334:353-1582(+)